MFRGAKHRDVRKRDDASWDGGFVAPWGLRNGRLGAMAEAIVTKNGNGPSDGRLNGDVRLHSGPWDALHTSLRHRGLGAMRVGYTRQEGWQGMATGHLALNMGAS